MSTLTTIHLVFLVELRQKSHKLHLLSATKTKIALDLKARYLIDIATDEDYITITGEGDSVIDEIMTQFNRLSMK